MRVFLKVFALTLANCAALFCAHVAFCCFFGLDNPLEAVLPLAVLVLFCVFQPWLFVVCGLCSVGINYLTQPSQNVYVISGAFVLTLLSSLLTLRIYRTLYLHGKLTRILRYRGGIKAAVAGILGLASLCSYAGYKDFPMQNAAAGTERIVPLFHFSIAQNGISTTDTHFYVLPTVSSYQVLWQAHVPRAQMVHFEAVSGMQRVSEKIFSGHFWDKPPYWWRRPNGELQAYKDYGFSEEGVKDGAIARPGYTIHKPKPCLYGSSGSSSSLCPRRKASCLPRVAEASAYQQAARLTGLTYL